jgi:hypothetical protein
MELRRRIEKLSIPQLKGLDAWLHDLIADREAPVELQERKGREVVARIVKPGGTLQLELVHCGKAPRCKSCPHGPYWYRYWKDGGKTKSEYVGKPSVTERMRFAEQIASARLKGSPVIASR